MEHLCQPPFRSNLFVANVLKNSFRLSKTLGVASISIKCSGRTSSGNKALTQTPIWQRCRLKTCGTHQSHANMIALWRRLVSLLYNDFGASQLLNDLLRSLLYTPPDEQSQLCVSQLITHRIYHLRMVRSWLGRQGPLRPSGVPNHQ